MFTKAIITTISICVVSWSFLLAQPPSLNAPIQLKRTTGPIQLDGKLDEPSWFDGAPANNFWSYFPDDSTRSPVQTEIYMAFDDNYLYIGAKCYSVGEAYIVPSLRRDYRAGGNDNLTFLFDTFNDRTNAFVFGINPLGVRREALVSNGGVDPGRDWDSSWDNKWDGVAKIYDGYWISELAIPFTTLRFPEGSQEWNFNSYRFDTQSNTTSTWNQIPRNQIITNLAFMGKMQWEEPLQKPGSNVSLIPYVSSNYEKDFEAEDLEDGEVGFNVGGDVKVGVTAGLNLDLTFNPDFSQVEVDRQVINLDRFELFFPERRQFFLENADLFGGFGDQRINPFFSRRIGIATDTTDDERVQNPILYGARLSGKLDNNWRLGFLNMQTAEEEDFGLPSYNYTVAALQRKVFSRSNVGLIFVNKQTFQSLRTDTADVYDMFNRVAGLDYNLASSDNKWTGKAYYHQAFTEDDLPDKFAQGGRLQFQNRDISVRWQHQYVGEGYDAEVGFVPRKNFFRIDPEIRLFYYPGKGIINEHGPSVQTTFIWTPEYGRTDHRLDFDWRFSLRNTSRIQFTVSNQYIFLLDEFDPTRTDATPLPGKTDYNYTSFEFSYNSDRRKKLAYRLRPNIGQFFNGNAYGMSGSLIYRYQPFGAIEINYNYRHIDLPDPYATADLFLLGTRIDLTFTKNIFLTTFLQYNDQVENVNINARLQWRFAPVSDFFLVYTENFESVDFATKNRAIVAKVTYWLNI